MIVGKQRMRRKAPLPAALMDIVRLAEKLAGFSAGCLSGRRKDMEVVHWRQAGMVVAAERGVWSLTMIGHAFGRHYTTVMYARNVFRTGPDPDATAKRTSFDFVHERVLALRQAIASDSEPAKSSIDVAPVAVVDDGVAEARRVLDAAAAVTGVPLAEMLKVHRGAANAGRAKRALQGAIYVGVAVLGLPTAIMAIPARRRRSFIGSVKRDWDGRVVTSTGDAKLVQAIVAALEAGQQLKPLRRPAPVTPPPVPCPAAAPQVPAVPADKPWHVEARRFRHKGWSVAGLARRFNVREPEMAQFLGVPWAGGEVCYAGAKP